MKAVLAPQVLVLLLPCLVVASSTFSTEFRKSKSALDDLLYQAGDMESFGSNRDICACAVESYDFSDLERPLLGYNGHLSGTDASGNGNGTNWAAAECSQGSDANLRTMVEANASLSWPITRGQAVMLCNSKKGNPQLMVDEFQNCKCCPIQCGTGSDKVHSCCKQEGSAAGKYDGLTIDNAADACETMGFGSTFTLSTDGFRICGCKCDSTTSLYDAQEKCTKHGHTFEGCNKCSCKAPNEGTTIQDAKKACMDTPGNNYFDDESCSCYCSTSKENKVNFLRSECSASGYDFLGGSTCDCICKGGHYDKTSKNEAESSCIGNWPSSHAFFPATGDSVSDGSCTCTCKAGRYKGKTVQDAATLCANDGGLPDETNDPCNCMCMNEENQRTTISIETSRLACEKAKDSMPGVFVSHYCKCKCSDNSPKYAGNLVSVAENTCETTHHPHYLKLIDQKCHCKCSAGSDVDVDTAKTTCQNDIKGVFTHPCKCCPSSSSSPCHKDYEYIKSNTHRCMDDAANGECKTFCETAGGAYDNHFKCKCNVDADEGTNATANGGKVKLSTDLFKKKHECEAKQAEFWPNKCDCVCQGSLAEAPVLFEAKKTQCYALKNHYGNPGVFDPPTCKCMCSSHKGVFHGSYLEQVGTEQYKTVSAADLACEGTLVINQINGTLAECECKALATEPCCNSGSGELLTTFKERCNSTCIIGSVADCNCDTAEFCDISGKNLTTDFTPAEKDLGICTTSKDGAMYNEWVNQNAMDDCVAKGGTFVQEDCDCNIPPGGSSPQSDPPVPAATASPTPTPLPQGPAHFQSGSMCLEYMRGTNGHFVKATDCAKDHGGQIWTLSSGKMSCRLVGSDGYQRCLKVSNSQGNVYMEKCSDTDDEQKWTFEEHGSGGKMRSLKQYTDVPHCLFFDPAAAHQDTGVNIFLRPCEGTTAGEMEWKFESPQGMELSECHVSGVSYSNAGTGHYNGANKDAITHATAKHGKTFAVELKAKVTGGTGIRSPATMRSFKDGKQAGWMIYALAEGLWAFAIGIGNDWYTIVGGVVVENQFQKLVASYDDTTKQMRLYIDGVLTAQNTAPANLREQEGNKPLYIGAGKTEDYGKAQGADAAYFFKGEVKEVKIGTGIQNCAEVSDLSASAISLELDTVEQELADYVQLA